MSTESKPQTGKGFGLWKFITFASLGLCISWLIAMITFGNFVDINPDLYARTFMVWRNKGGDAAMFEGRYKGYNKNDYKEDAEFSRFIDFAQNKDGYIIAGNYPLHAPRGPEKLYTLIDKKRIVEELWKVEFNVKALLNDKITEKQKEDFRNKAIKSLKEKKYEQEFKSQWFVEDSNITPDMIKKVFQVGKNAIWLKAAPVFVNILSKLANNDDNYKFKNGKVTSELFKDISSLFKELGYNADDYKEQINKFFINMGTVKATPFETFAYSRLFNLYTFLTINHTFDYKREISKDEIKKKNEFHSKEKAEIFAHIFANVYEKPFNYEMKNATFMEKLTKFFGTSQNIDNITKDQSDNIKSSIAKMEENLEISSQD